MSWKFSQGYTYAKPKEAFMPPALPRHKKSAALASQASARKKRAEKRLKERGQ